MASYHRPQEAWSDKNVVVAILAKDKAHCLPRYLKCLENQTWPKTRTLVYIRTNNNNDATREMLQAWVEAQRKISSKKDGQGYVSIYLDTSDVEAKVQQWTPHEWNETRFKVLGAIRRASVEYAMRHDAHYFVVDCDNFIVPSTLEAMCESGYDAIAPVLTTSGHYSNFHFKANTYGYMEQTWCDSAIPELRLRGIVECDTIHCTYFLSHDVLKYAIYDDGTSRYEYAILADQLRKAKVAQYMDNRVDYGRLTFADDLKALEAESWIGLFPLEPVAATSYKVVAPPGLSITYGGARTLRMDVTQQCCNLFLRDKTIVFPSGCDLNARFGDHRPRVAKTLNVEVDGKLLRSIPERPSEEMCVILPDALWPAGLPVAPVSTPSSPTPISFASPKKPISAKELKTETTGTAKEKWLIISPHAGFGNRLRALCSGIVLAKQLGRTPVHAWFPEGEEDVRMHAIGHHLRQTRRLGWSDYFAATKKFPAIDEERLRRECKSIKCYTEWMPGDFWYGEQSRYQRRLANLGIAVERVRVSQDRIGQSNITSVALDPKNGGDDTYLLLETSLSVRFAKPRLDKHTGERKSTVADEKRYERKFSRVYRKYFAPLQEFTDMMETLTSVPLGFHIRRGDRLLHVPEADIKVDALVTTLSPIIGTQKCVICSDDRVYRDTLVTQLHKTVYEEPVKLAANIPQQWKSAFIEFLTLALKCDVVYGTGLSSFSREAASFGGKPFVPL
jgi:hypothetical protein